MDYSSLIVVTLFLVLLAAGVLNLAESALKLWFGVALRFTIVANSLAWVVVSATFALLAYEGLFAPDMFAKVGGAACGTTFAVLLVSGTLRVYQTICRWRKKRKHKFIFA
jgi:hypothetical protein